MGSRSTGAPAITVVRGDITSQAVDAIVNAANTAMQPGGGVDGAITRAAGAAALADRMRVVAERGEPPLSTGEAVATIAGDLASRWIIHTAGPVFSGHERDADLLARCYINSLAVADELGAESIAFPAISCGVYGYPPDQAAPIAIGAVTGAVTAVRSVRFVLLDEPMERTFHQALVASETAMSDHLTTVSGVFEQLDQIQVVDCREPYEWEAGRVEGAVHIPLNDIMAGAGQDLDVARPVAVICRSGNRSELATMMLQARGFEAYNIEGGMEAWAAEGLPFSTPDGSPGHVA
ncbi:MAG TPA: macro domain-containing protein [Actinomycetota bacterium]